MCTKTTLNQFMANKLRTYIGMLKQDFLSMSFAINLLNTMQENPDFKWEVMPPLTTDFLMQIENDDLNNPDISEDDSGSIWGHHQFTSGTITSILKSWESIGNTEMVCKLITAAIKTCREGLPPHPYKYALFDYVVAVHFLLFTLYSCL